MLERAFGDDDIIDKTKPFEMAEEFTTFLSGETRTVTKNKRQNTSI